MYREPRRKDGKPQTASIAGVTSQSINDAVEAVQPYSGHLFSAPAESHPLYLLNELANADKHRLLLLAVFALQHERMYWSVPDGAESPEPTLNLKPLKEGDPVAWFDFGGVRPYPDFDPHLGLKVCLDASTGFQGSVPVLNVMGMIDYWVENVVIAHQFAPLLGVRPRFRGPLSS
jgi:hypothetical protein